MCDGNEPGQPIPALLSEVWHVLKNVLARVPRLAGAGGGVALVKSLSTVFNTGF